MIRKYILVKRENFDGSTVEAVGDHYSSIVEATDAVRNDLIETYGIPKHRAGEYAYYMTACRIGAIHSSPDADVSYRILEADFTSDGRAILPGLRVLDYDRREGTVAAAQFMNGSTMYPGGEYFDRWYFVLPDGEGGPRKRFDGSRMKSLRQIS